MFKQFNHSDLLKRLRSKLESGKKIRPSAYKPQPVEGWATLEGQEALAAHFGLLFAAHLSAWPFVEKRLAKVPYSFAKQHLVLPLDEKEGLLFVAMRHPFDLDVFEELSCLISLRIQPVIAPKIAIEEAIEQCYHQGENEASDYIASLQQESGLLSYEEQEDDLLDQNASSPVIRMLNIMLREAIQQGASDIHFEPTEQGLGVRYRIDGVLQPRHAPPKEFQSQLITRIKVMAQLDIAEQRLPQDGRIKLRLGGRHIDFRVSTVPVNAKERIVMRILDKGNVVLGLNQIGMREEIAKPFSKLISLTEGIVLVTGPTGSGKTTTLYSALSALDHEEMNIMTIEDPVEYKLSGLAQIGVNPKIDLTFATGLRHILRQDPDVIMIGEIRDTETAEVAIHASLTGHLVLSTLHTNDAPSALTRLVDMGIAPYLLSSSVIGVLAQRLVRLICPACRMAYTPSDQELVELGVARSELPHNTLYKGGGCEACFGSGFKGRRGIYELMVMSSPLKEQLLKSADALALSRVALSLGMSSLRHEGARLAIQGVTASFEVLRVTRGAEGA